MDIGQFLQDPVGVIGDLLTQLLAGLGLAPQAITVILQIIGVVVIASFCLLLPLFLIWFERRVVARMQDRVGPNRVGPQGLLQTIADALKLLIKEDITPHGADKVVYNVAPIMSVVAVIAMWAVIPFAATIVGTSLNVGALYIVSVGSLGTLAIMMAGWSSNNKYALLGAFRTVAQLVSYEAPLLLSLLVPVLLARSMDMNTIVERQEVWYIVAAPIAALIFFVTSVAEVGRTPFDLLEAESEIVAGFHIEYTGMKFGMFFVAEFLHAFTVGALTAVLFLGGWRGPGVDIPGLGPWLGIVYFMLKAFAGYFIVILMRTTLPRIRIDHMLDLNWKFLVPLALAVIVVTMLGDKSMAAAGLTDPWVRGGLLFLLNIVLAAVTYGLLSSTARRLRAAEEAALAGPDALSGGSADGHNGHGDGGHTEHAAPDAAGHGPAAAPAH
ncbi:MAG: NADH-quinone oxidoreductase subunit NuoH [Anaerolineales bacterium]|nr:NADH-quinone oxidoreductase subunit NuoH [Anaerolineales bacterium]